MTKAHSMLDDNGGRCECCNKPETKYQEQRTYPVRLGGDLGMGTMWLCLKCLQEHELRDKKEKTMKFKMILDDACCPRMRAAVEQTNVVVFFAKDEVTVYIPRKDGEGNMKIEFCPFCGTKIEKNTTVSNL